MVAARTGDPPSVAALQPVASRTDARMEAVMNGARPSVRSRFVDGLPSCPVGASRKSKRPAGLVVMGRSAYFSG